jgi:hypothetical protein
MKEARESVTTFTCSYFKQHQFKILQKYELTEMSLAVSDSKIGHTKIFTNSKTPNLCP